MADIGHCRDCRWWTDIRPWRQDQRWGVCSSLEEDTVSVDYMGDFWCAGNFGCVQFEPKESK